MQEGSLQPTRMGLDKSLGEESRRFFKLIRFMLNSERPRLTLKLLDRHEGDGLELQHV